ncbi:class I SAM-dependent methyltransferase [Uliginosibacterium sp. TH139]|uniref:class I SAM-dependent methyltransferase n=1 Tax=Uliginosibacterium sp. TH139 TaxID=2067453 RepID=UPI001303FB39|nr:class I SAM-dependent methyltransferase [Uliginosibacterium sp. TH139]
MSSYDQVLADLRSKPVSMLEIGVQNGGSLEIWSKYFKNAHSLVGCDIDQRCERLSYSDERISLVIGDINNKETLEQVLKISTEFDLIIDDGSHASGDIVKSFARLFSRVKEDGVYIVEDLHCSYWAHYQGGVFYPESSINFFKMMVDVVNHQHWGNGYSRTKVVENFCSAYGCEISEEDLSNIHSIEFFNSICVIKKKNSDKNVLGTRLISGSVFDVCEPAQINSFSRIVQASEFGNKWAFVQKTAQEHDEEKRLLEGEKNKFSEENERLSAALNKLSAEAESMSSYILKLEKDVKHFEVLDNEKSIHLEQMAATLSWRITKPLRAMRRVFRNTFGR